MSFHTVRADAISHTMLSTDYYGKSVTLTDREGVDTEATAKPGPEITEERAGGERGIEIVVTRVFFLALTGSVPKTVTFDNVIYAVEDSTKQSEFTILKTKRIGLRESSRDSYRNRKP